ncbi:MAG: bifunctional YncE family protein/alkaline phosphatase family protein [Planctomycetes bacterium]|nr:bifunctional YncE family protein/alkaline phosphatase family protein [Planctomycetota bacterium]
MRKRSLLAILITFSGCFVLFATLDPKQPPAAPKEEPALKLASRPPVVLPGINLDGSIQLPNQWQLRPAGRAIEVGDFPVNMAMHPSGQYVAVLHAGMREHEIIVVALEKTRQRIVSRTSVDQTFYGVTFTPDGKKLFASGGEFEVVHEFDFARGMLGIPRKIDLPSGDDKSKRIIGGLAIDKEGRDLFAAATWGDVVVRIPIDNPENKVTIPVGRAVAKGEKKDEKAKGEPPSPDDGRKKDKEGKEIAKKAKDDPVHPYAILPDPLNKRLFVSLWAAGSVAVIDLEKNEMTALWSTESHPTEMVLSPNGKSLYVACANSTLVSVLDTADGKALQTINCALYPQAPSGNTPNSLTLTPDGQILFVANADASNLALFNVVNPKEAKPLGFIPTGWYPTSVRYHVESKKIIVANGKGMFSKPNRSGPGPYSGRATNITEYIGSLFTGTLSFIDMPTPEKMGEYSKQAYACSPLKKDFTANTDGVEADNPIPKKVGEPSPIKYVIYIVKENRTYDQVFGDLPQGNGEARLCLFPKSITPNHHKLAEEFVLLDNTYVEGEVSADGHEWSMGAYATDFTEKAWPLGYRGGKRIGYPSEGHYDYIEKPAGGYIWDRAFEAKVSYRSYGEWITNGKINKDGTIVAPKANSKNLIGHFDPQFHGYDLDYPDVKRAERFLSEVKRFEGEGEMPRLQIVRLPNDHTSGTRLGTPTPTAMVAENDLALGMLVEGVSQSKFWKETAIFVIEDDAQNGPDHVDAHRVVALVISPYTKRKFVDSTMYSTSSMLRTMELILGLKPMSQFDAAARPMFNSFTAKPDVTPYKHEVPKTDLNAKNLAGAWGQEWSQKANLEKEDAADDLLFNEVIWKSVKGSQSKLPAPVRAAFFRSREGDDDEDD